MAERRGGDRLDQPLVGRRRLTPTVDQEAFGRWTERVARFLGTGRYLIIQTVFTVLWIAVNIIPGVPHFDPYTFTFLTLVLSLQAAYAAPLILLAQNRQDDRDRVNLIEDRQQTSRGLEDTEFLARELAEVRQALGDVVTRDFLRAELRDLLAEMLLPGDGGAARAAPKKKTRKRPDQPRERTDVAPLGEPQAPGEPAADAESLTD